MMDEMDGTDQEHGQRFLPWAPREPLLCVTKDMGGRFVRISQRDYGAKPGVGRSHAERDKTYPGDVVVPPVSLTLYGFVLSTVSERAVP